MSTATKKKIEITPDTLARLIPAIEFSIINDAQIYKVYSTQEVRDITAEKIRNDYQAYLGALKAFWGEDDWESKVARYVTEAANSVLDK